VTLYAKRSVENAGALVGALETSYGIDAKTISVVSFFSRRSGADNLRIALMAARELWFQGFGETIISRNLYAAFLFGVLQRRPLIFETHQLERGVRKAIQRLVMTRPWITTVAISDKLVEHLIRHHRVSPRHVVVLHDAAPAGITPIDERHRRAILHTIVPVAAGDWDAVCGYFGQLYAGRGIEIVEALAAQRPRMLFLVYGGNDADVQARRAANRQSNLQFMGHVSHPIARQIMAAMDVLLMPYQHQVSIGVAGHDTANWMSPMKMFEYLASGVPIVASDLPSLREVLRDGANCLMVQPGSVDAWAAAIDRIIAQPALATTLGRRAHHDYRDQYTWVRRAEALLNAASSR
jgi:hypothetical protein